MGDALGADEEDQRLAAATAGVEAGQARGVVGAQGVGVGADLGLGEEGQRLQVGHAAHGGGVEAGAGEELAVVGHMRGHTLQQGLQPLELQVEDALTRPPLRGFHVAVHAHGVVLLQLFLEREERAGDEAGVEVAHDLFSQATGRMDWAGACRASW